MKIPPMTIPQVWQAAGIVALALALPILIWGGGAPPAPEPRGETELGADMPALPATGVAAEDREELTRSTMWGGAPVADAAAESGGSADAQGPAWSLAGVFMKDERREVVLRFAGDAEAPRLLGEGAALPDGAVVEQIERDRIRLRGTDHDTTWWVHVNRGAEAVQRAD